MISTIYQVTGMTCEHCVRAVTEEIENLAGVSAVTVALVPGGESAVTVTSDAPLTPEAVTAALDEAGAYRLAGSAGDTGGLGYREDATAAPVFVTPARALPLV